MEHFDFALAGFGVMLAIVYAAALVFAVREQRRWKFTAWAIALAVILFPVSFFFFPIAVHFARPKMRDSGVEGRIVRLKLVLAWAVPVFVIVGTRLCAFFCNRLADGEFSGELAASCSMACVFLYELLLIWVNPSLDEPATESGADAGR